MPKIGKLYRTKQRVFCWLPPAHNTRQKGAGVLGFVQKPIEAGEIVLVTKIETWSHGGDRPIGFQDRPMGSAGIHFLYKEKNDLFIIYWPYHKNTIQIWFQGYFEECLTESP